MRDTHELVSDTNLDQSPKISASLHVLLVSMDGGLRERSGSGTRVGLVTTL